MHVHRVIIIIICIAFKQGSSQVVKVMSRIDSIILFMRDHNTIMYIPCCVLTCTGAEMGPGPTDVKACTRIVYTVWGVSSLIVVK